ncbi:MAG: hypothetical protein ACE5HI_05995 [bacterium]
MKFVIQKQFTWVTFAVFVIVMFLTSVATLFSQESSLDYFEQAFAQIDSNIAHRNAQRTALTRKVQAYAEQIQELKTKEQLNYFQHQRLESLLKDSQDLSNQIESIDSELRALNKKFRTSGNKLISLYESEIKQSLKNLEKKNISSKLRQTYFQKIASLRTKKERVQQKIGRIEFKEFTLSKLQIEPDDSPKQIEQKADLLKDQEDKLRRFASQLNKQTRQLKREMEIRNRMSDLVTDLAVFDQQEEALGNVSAASGEALEVADQEDRFVGIKDKNKLIEENLIVGQKDFDFANLSAEQLDEVIENLNKRQKRMQSQADSLARQAELFYKAAQDMKKQ